jgi:hypothetical protein
LKPGGKLTIQIRPRIALIPGFVIDQKSATISESQRPQPAHRVAHG